MSFINAIFLSRKRVIVVEMLCFFKIKLLFIHLNKYHFKKPLKFILIKVNAIYIK